MKSELIVEMLKKALYPDAKDDTWKELKKNLWCVDVEEPDYEQLDTGKVPLYQVVKYFFGFVGAQMNDKGTKYRISNKQTSSKQCEAIFNKMQECYSDPNEQKFFLIGTLKLDEDFQYCIFIEPVFEDASKIFDLLYTLDFITFFSVDEKNNMEGDSTLPIAENYNKPKHVGQYYLNRAFRKLYTSTRDDGTEIRAYFTFVPVPITKKQPITNCFYENKDNKGNVDYRDVSYLRQYLFDADSRLYSRCVRYIPLPVASQASNATAGEGWPYNFIISGAPGTGKSYTLNQHVNEETENDYVNKNQAVLKKDSKGNYIEIPEDLDDWRKKHVRRVTFYEDYSYENFVGCYKPQPDDHKINITTDKITTSSSTTVNEITGKLSSTEITYKYQPGPFIDTYVEAKKNSEEKYFLIIEEINRARAASVFGDIFQLLDRDSNGESTYSITPEPDLADYLSSQGLTGEMRIPSNMYIWATMNNADQGVNPLDSAFKRRWGYLYMGIDSVNVIHPQNSKFVTNSGGPVLCIGSDANGLKGVNWNNFRTALNERLLANGVSEDKCIGPYYFSEEEFLQIENYYMKNKNKRILMVNPLRDKLLLYLFTDVCRNNPGLLFNDNIKSMHDIRNEVN